MPLKVTCRTEEAHELSSRGYDVVLVVVPGEGGLGLDAVAPCARGGQKPGRIAVLVGDAGEHEVRWAAESMGAELFNQPRLAESAGLLDEPPER